MLSASGFNLFRSDKSLHQCDAHLVCDVVKKAVEKSSPAAAAWPPIPNDFRSGLEPEDYPVLGYVEARQMIADRKPGGGLLLEPRRLVIFEPDTRVMRAYTCEDSILKIRSAVDFFLFLFCACLLGNNHGILLHAFGLVIDGLACVITGPSGAGKSTAGSLIKKDFILADDLVGITGIGDRVEAHATPISSTRITDGPCRAPLAAIFFPVRADRFRIQSLSPREGFVRYLHEHSHYVGRLIKEYKPVYFELAHILFQQVPCYELHFSLEGIDTGEVRRVMEAGAGMGD